MSEQYHTYTQECMRVVLAAIRHYTHPHSKWSGNSWYNIAMGNICLNPGRFMQTHTLRQSDSLLNLILPELRILAFAIPKSGENRSEATALARKNVSFLSVWTLFGQYISPSKHHSHARMRVFQV